MRWILFQIMVEIFDVWSFISLSFWKIYIPLRVVIRRIIIYKRLLSKNYPTEKIQVIYIRWLNFTTFLKKRRNLIALERLSNETGIPFGVLQGYVQEKSKNFWED